MTKNKVEKKRVRKSGGCQCQDPELAEVERARKKETGGGQVPGMS